MENVRLLGAQRRNKEVGELCWGRHRDKMAMDMRAGTMEIFFHWKQFGQEFSAELIVPVTPSVSVSLLKMYISGENI